MRLAARPVLVGVALVGAALAGAALAGPAAQAQPEPAEDGRSVSGIVADSAGAPLPGAHVLLLRQDDAVLVGFDLAGTDGAFQIERVPDGSYVLRASFIGYASQEIAVEVRGEAVEAGEVRLVEEASELGQLVVSAERPPVVMRGDTLVYDASDFQVRQGAKVEDLLRKLPGVEVDADGTVRANGRVVQDVLVDGKEFFGGTPTVATQNLPADAVERVELFDRRSSLSEFAGVDDGQSVQALNLELKEDRKSGLFGSAEGGPGSATPTDGRLRYAGKGLVNRFGADARLSVLGRANNVNRAGLSIREYLSLVPRPETNGGGSTAFTISDALPVGDRARDGFSTTSLVGANGSYEPAPQTEVQATYLGYRVRTEREERASRERLSGDQAFREEEDADRLQVLAAHRLALVADRAWGDGHGVELRSDVQVSSSRAESQVEAERFGLDGDRLPSAAAASALDTESLRGEAALTYRRRLGDTRTLAAELRAEHSETDEEDRLLLETQLSPTAPPFAEQQQYRSGEAVSGAGLEVRGTQRLGTHQMLQVSAALNTQAHRLTQRAQDLAPQPAGGTLGVVHERSRFGVDYRGRVGALHVGAGLGAENTRAAGGEGDVAFGERSRLRLLPSAALRYVPAQSRRFEAEYRTSTRVPGVQALHPFARARGPFEIYQGNPALRSEYVHDLDLRFIHFDAFTLRSMFAFARATYTRGAISSARTVGADFRQHVTPVNVEQAWSLLGTASVGTPVRSLKGSITLSGNARYAQTTELLNGSDNQVGMLTASAGAEYQNQTAEPLDVRLGAQVRASAASFSLNPALNRTVAHLVPSLELGWYPGGGAELRTAVEYEARLHGDAAGAARTPLWGAEAAVGVGPRARLRLTATDLLGRSRSVGYEEGATYVEQSVTRTLGRHVLLTLEYDF